MVRKWPLTKSCVIYSVVCGIASVKQANGPCQWVTIVFVFLHWPCYGPQYPSEHERVSLSFWIFFFILCLKTASKKTFFQLFGLFRGHHGSIDCIALLSDEYFISGGDDGAINYWSTKRKKPICVVRNAHGGTWITALGALLNSDVFISGAADGFLRVWRPSADRSRIEQFHSIKAVSAFFCLGSIMWFSLNYYDRLYDDSSQSI